MATSEFDKIGWISIPGKTEPDIAAASISSSVIQGKIAGQFIGACLQPRGLSMPADATYLALAAGQGYAELALAAELGISYHNITFVDKTFHPENRTRLERAFPGLRLVERGMFSYLEDPDQTGFNLLTVLGVEYVFNDDAAMEELIRLAPRVLKPGAIICVDRWGRDTLSAIWQRSGFERLAEDTSFSVLYLFNPE